MLRASTDETGEELDYAAVTGGTAAGETGVAHGGLLIEFGEAVLTDDTARLDAARDAILETMGPDALVDSAAVAAMFNALDRVADSTGAPVEDWKQAETASIVSAIGIDAFAANKAALDRD